MKLNFSIKKHDLLTLLVIGLGAVISQAVDFLWVNILFASLAFAGIVWISNEKSSIHMMYLVGYSTFIFVPAILNGYYFNTGFDLFYATSVVTIVFLSKTKLTNYVPPPRSGVLYVALFGFYSVALVVFSLAFDGNFTIYLLSPCVMFYALCLKINKIYYNSLIFVVFLLVFGVYFVFGWSGYGRTVVFGNLIVALLYFIYVNNLLFNKLLFAMVPTLASLLLVGRKSLAVDDFSVYEVLSDSAVGPYRLADTFIENYNSRGFDFFGFMDQVVFSLTSFIPRDIWSSKPYGFGFEYVVKNMDEYLIDAGHSIASTLIGDHIYYLGWWGVGTGLLMAWFVAKLVNLFYNFKKLAGYAVVIISCNMMVLVWGGMTSFSARIIYPLIGLLPLWVAYMISRKILRNHDKMVRG